MEMWVNKFDETEIDSVKIIRLPPPRTKIAISRHKSFLFKSGSKGLLELQPVIGRIAFNDIIPY